MQGIKELLEDARKAIGAYLNRGNTDGIIVVLIKKYHDFLTDDERLALIDPQEQEVKSLGHDFFLPIHHDYKPDPFCHRITHLAVEHGKTDRTIEELEGPRNRRGHYRSGEVYITCNLKDT